AVTLSLLHSFPTRRSSDLAIPPRPRAAALLMIGHVARFYTSASLSRVGLYSYGENLARFVDADLDYYCYRRATSYRVSHRHVSRSEEHTSELQSPYDLVCR